MDAPSDLGKEANNDLGNEVNDEGENSAEEGADEATNLSEQGTDLDFDGDADDKQDRCTSTEDEVEQAGQELGNVKGTKDTLDKSAEDPVQREGSEGLNLNDNTPEGNLNLGDDGSDHIDRGIVGREATELIGHWGDHLDGGGEDNLKRVGSGVFAIVTSGDRIDGHTSGCGGRRGEGGEGQGGESRKTEETHCE